jgi:signal transduction histidine kinase/predicted CoA-binding protein
MGQEDNVYEFLKKIPLFSDLPEADLEKLCEMVEEVLLPAGQELFAEGDPGDWAYIIKDGAVEIIKNSQGRGVLLAVQETGEVIGEMALLEDSPRMASVKARRDTTLLAIHQDQFYQLLDTSPTASKVLLQTVLARWRVTTNMLRQNEKMIQLGTLTAGVAHELNNPAAAVKRGASQLKTSLEELETASIALARLSLPEDQLVGLRNFAEKTQPSLSHYAEMDALTRSDIEDDLAEWMEDLGIENYWDLAPSFVDMGYNVDSLRPLIDQFEPEQIGAIMQWLSANFQVKNLLEEIDQGAGRISEIVKSLKTYSYLDQAPVQEVDIHEGLESTLVILRSKIGSEIKVHRNYDPDLPHVQAYGSELNQVWTNLIDNAIDALNGNGDITIRTYTEENQWIGVEIEDNGPGIPPEIQPRVFDAFFTTKPPGKGTGLGLDISYNIIVNRHGGDMKLFSQPGKTLFKVSLPINSSNGHANLLPTAQHLRHSNDEIREILESSKTVATVGMSSRKDQPANSVPAYLKSHGYTVIPVNPAHETILGGKSYPDLESIPFPVDVVQIFRPSEEVPPIVDQAIKIGAKTVWMQEGIINQHAAEVARRAGLNVVMDECMRSKHRQLISDQES